MPADLRQTRLYQRILDVLWAAVLISLPFTSFPLPG